VPLAATGKGELEFTQAVLELLPESPPQPVMSKEKPKQKIPKVKLWRLTRLEIYLFIFKLYLINWGC
jgi:hypothetical protein